jgi:hypothetical protein
MGSGPVSFKETDVKRAIKSAREAGLHVVGFEIDPKTGKIRVDVGKADPTSPTHNDWDKALEDE